MYVDCSPSLSLGPLLKTWHAQNFAEAILDPAPPSPVSLLAMIRLNEGVIDNLVTSSACPPMENHLIGLRLLLWPVFAKVMTVQIESVRKINGTLPSGGVFGGKNTNVEVKDSAVQVVGMRYTELFNACVALSGEQDEEMVFSRCAFQLSSLRALLMEFVTA